MILFRLSTRKFINRYSLFITAIVVISATTILWRLISVHIVQSPKHLPLPHLLFPFTNTSTTLSTHNISPQFITSVPTIISLAEEIKQCRLSFQSLTTIATNNNKSKTSIVCPQISNNWHIDWNYLLLDLDYKNITTKHYSQISNKIQWYNSEYKGFCRPLLYPHIGIMRNLWGSNDLSYEANQAVITKIVNEENGNNVGNMTTVNNNININDNILNQTEMMEYRYHINWQLLDWYNTSIIRKDNKRVEYFETNSSVWRIASVWIEIEKEYDFAIDKEGGEEGEREEDIVESDDTELNVEETEMTHARRLGVVLNDHDAMIDIVNVNININDILINRGYNTVVKILISRNNMDKLARFNFPYFLCVFNDGTVVISNPIRKSRVQSAFAYEFLIVCDISKSTSLVSKLLHPKLLKLQKISFETNIGVTLFGLQSKNSDIELLNEYLVAMHVQIPVCRVYEINRKPQIYQSEWEYHNINIDINSIDKKRKNRNEDKNKNNNNNKNNDAKKQLRRWMDPLSLQLDSILNNETTLLDRKQDRKYFLSLSTILHPSDRMGEMEIMIKQWLDYHLLHGFEHFYLFDHLCNRNNDNILFFWDILQPYMNDGKVTYILAPMIVRPREHAYYQFTAIMDAIHLIRFETTFVLFADVDEWVIVYDKTNPETNSNQQNQTEQKQMMMTDMPTAYEYYRHMFESTRFDIHTLLDIHGLQDVWSLIHDQLDSNLKNKSTNNVLTLNENSWYQNEIPISLKGKQLGCDKKNSNMRFDTFLQRHSCLYYKLQNIDEKYQYKQNKIQKTLNKLARKTKGTKKFYQPKLLYYLHKPTYNKQINNIRHFLSYEIKPKILIDPSIVHLTFHHRLFSLRYSNNIENANTLGNTIENNQEFFIVNDTNNIKRKEKNLYPNLNVFLLHTSDHFRRLAQFMNFSNIEHLRFFFQITQSKCDFQNDILYWNDRFLNSDFGKKKYYKKLTVQPNLDENGMFCYYHSNSSFKAQWTIAGRFKKHRGSVSNQVSIESQSNLTTNITNTTLSS